MLDKDNIPINYDAPQHLGHCEPTGRLPRVQQAPALWQFLTQVHIMLEKIPAQATLTTNPDITVTIREVADSVAMMYGVTVEQMLNPGLVGMARLEAIRCGLEWDDRFTAWYESGGRAYNTLTRDPSKLYQG